MRANRGRVTTEYAKQSIVEALGREGCAVCRLVREREEKVFWWFFAENYHEASVLADFVDNSFLCDHHAKLLIDGDHTSLAFVFHFLVQGDIRRFGELSAAFAREKPDSLPSCFRRGRNRQTKVVDDHVKGYSSCRFCQLSENASRYIEGLFAELIGEDAGFRDLYRKSPGLCRRHLVEILRLSADKGSADFFLNDTIHRLERMKERFDLYFHRLDYRFAREPKGAEQETWLEALRYYSGAGTGSQP